ncbi:MAG: hypothetical protein E6I94_02480 [Chloroflexi bacterium]|nr:MAG: hypothetical protein E6I94_02480 [Chloroflexota bacterium]
MDTCTRRSRTGCRHPAERRTGSHAPARVRGPGDRGSSRAGPRGSGAPPRGSPPSGSGRPGARSAAGPGAPERRSCRARCRRALRPSR